MTPKFTSDWFSHHISDWEMWLHNFKNLSHLDFLEIGSYEGRSAVWLLDNIIQNETCKITCIDQFVDDDYEKINNKPLRKQFMENLGPYIEKGKITIFQNQSFDALSELIRSGKQYDFIYIDGCHMAKSVMEDAILSFKLLKKNGIMIFDDNNWNVKKNIHECPRLAINSFMSVYSWYIKIIYCGDQLVVRKI